MWQIKIQDPSGEIRAFSFPSSNSKKTVSLRLGRNDSDAQILLRDPTLPETIGTLQQTPQTSFWLTLDPNAPAARVADMEIRNAEILPRIPWKIGESSLTILPQISVDDDTPVTPTGARPWKTQTRSGREVLWLAKKSAHTSLSVYLKGETGTGKDILAHLIHQWSPRSSGPFVPINCGALPLSLVESELFGHTKGAFTGAVQHRGGALLQAHRGTLFLDEVGDLPSEAQAKLLRFLENGEIRPVGSDRMIHADVRILCASHKDLEQLVEQKKFRQDLFFRLTPITLQIPPLRERPNDITILANTFVADFKKYLSQTALLRLQSYSWPGNVRELRHAIERAAGLTPLNTSILTAEDFSFLDHTPPLRGAPSSPHPGFYTLRDMERLMILKALQITQGHRAQAAHILGISRSALFDKIKRHRIIGPRHSGFFTQPINSESRPL